jgi:2-polyprenyl-3-methyl-5-hydroxy-6-metoxy-1,4-benzoquinol methylase
MKLIQSDYENDYHDNFLLREAPNSQRIGKRLALLLAHKQSGSLLEIGVGKGGLLRRAQQHFEVEGLDISQHEVDALIPHFGERVRRADVETKTLPRLRYDAIVIFNVLEHLRQPGQVIQKLWESLQAGGVMIGSMPNNFGLVGGQVTRLGNFFDRTHVSTYTPAAWRGLFQQAGFTEIDFFGEITIGRNAAVYLRGPLWPYLSFNLMFVCRK